MQVVTSFTENGNSKRSVALVRRKGQILLEEGSNHAEQNYCAAVINRHLEKVSGPVEIENEP
jgi:hypothetical protein